MRILLTGATGFIGSAVLRSAARHGHDVAALVRPGRASVVASICGVRPLAGTLADPPWNEIAAFKAEVCIHSAWITTPDIYLETPENDQWAAWSESFITKAVATGVRRVIALGTCIEYGMTGGILSEETTPLVPASTYARSKDGLRQWLDQAAGKAGYSHVWGRIFYPYGPGEHPARLCSSAIRQIRSGAPWVTRNPNSVKDYIFIEDLAAAILVLAASDACGAINLGTGSGVAMGEIVRTIADLLGRPELVGEARWPAPDPFGFVVADVRRLQALGWQPRVTLGEGLRRLIQHLARL